MVQMMEYPRPQARLALRAARRIGLQLLDLVYPLFCVLCGAKVPPDSGELCAACLETFPRNEPPFCPFCGQGRLIRFHSESVLSLSMVRLFESDPTRCPCCQGRPFVFERAWSAALYEGPVRDSIHHFKYRERVLLAKPLGEFLVDFARHHLPIEGFDAVVPVPLSRHKQSERGFNQAFLLSQSLLRAFRLPLLGDGLRRLRETPSQIKLSRDQRWHNVEGAFRVKTSASVQGRRFLLVDDVFTTGATVNACAAALKEAGAASVSALTLARGQ